MIEHIKIPSCEIGYQTINLLFRVTCIPGLKYNHLRYKEKIQIESLPANQEKIKRPYPYGLVNVSFTGCGVSTSVFWSVL